MMWCDFEEGDVCPQKARCAVISSWQVSLMDYKDVMWFWLVKGSWESGYSRMELINVTESTTVLLGNISEPQGRAQCLDSKFIIHTVIAGVICFIGFVGNSISLFALSKDKQSPVATFLLQSLTLVDNMFLGIWFLQFSMKFALKYAAVEQDLHVAWPIIRLYTYPLLFAAQTATIWMTVVIAVTRYISICIPYRASQLVNMDMARKSVAGVVLFSITYNIPRFFEGYLTVYSSTNFTYHFTWLGTSDLYRII